MCMEFASIVLLPTSQMIVLKLSPQTERGKGKAGADLPTFLARTRPNIHLKSTYFLISIAY